MPSTFRLRSGKRCTLDFVLGIAWLLLAANYALAQPDKPNFVLILSDDHGVENSGAYGDSLIETPNIDRLASEGLRFDAAFATQAICTPSRTSVFTGLYPMRHGAHRNHTRVLAGTKSLPHYFSPLGYRVALAGKTHFGPEENFPFEQLGALTIKGQVISRQLADIKQLLNAQQPFFLVVATSLPHTLFGDKPYPDSNRYPADTIELPPYLVDTPETRRHRAGYYELVSQLDEEIGVLVNAVDSSKAADNTYLIYASDHGAGFAFEKWTNYDAGIRVPLIIRAPRQDGSALAGKSTPALVSLVDLLPTMLELASEEKPQLDIDGRSFAKLLRPQSVEQDTGQDHRRDQHRDYIFATHTTLGIRNASDPMPIRTIRNDRFKYIRNLNPGGTLTNNVTEKTQSAWPSWVAKANAGDAQAAARIKAYTKRAKEELYSLEADPYELSNLAGVIGYETTLNSMRATLDLEMARQNDLGLDAPHTESNLGFMQISGLVLIELWSRIKGFFLSLF